MIFLSHANPEDNEFTLWLSLRLAREGYPVWCDLTRLLGGEDFWKEADKTIREGTIKFLYVLSKTSNTKDGPLQELAVAKKVARKHRLKDFVIPLVVDDLPTGEFNAELTRLTAIFFNKGRATGLKVLLDKLEAEKVPKEKESYCARTINEWWKTKYSAETGVVNCAEEYLSNWFEIKMPDNLYFYKIRLGLGDGSFLGDLPFPAVPYAGYAVSFASIVDLTSGGKGFVDHKDSFSITTADIIKDVSLVKFMTSRDLRNVMVRILRRGWDEHVRKVGLAVYEMANQTKAFYVPKNLIGKNRYSFDSMEGRISRALNGFRTVLGPGGTKKKRFWHFAVSDRPKLWPVFAYVVRSHVLFSDDEMNIWTHSKRMHRARRSQCNDWWNDDWRDRLLCMMNLLKGENDMINIQVGSKAYVEVSDWPVIFRSPVSYREPTSGRKMFISKDNGEYESVELEDEDTKDESWN